jgi:hypothetical protein
MEKAFNQSSVIKTLRDGIEKGYWTLEDLDEPSPGSVLARRITGMTSQGNVSMIKPYMLRPHRNLLRQAPADVRVEVIDPKDFPPDSTNASDTKPSNTNEPY